MADKHIKLWYQGKEPFVIPKCDGKPTFTCPESRRIAAEYTRGFYTLTNVLNPNIAYDGLGYSTWLPDELRKVEVGDTLWLVLVPPKHHIADVFAYNEQTLTEHSSLQSMGGLSFELVTGRFKSADANGDCALSGEESHGVVTMPATADAKEQFLRAATDITNDGETWTGVGIKLSALPTDKTLADIVGKLVVGCHVWDYDAQTFM